MSKGILLNGVYQRCKSCRCPLVICDGKVSAVITVIRVRDGLKITPHTLQCDKVKGSENA